MVSESGGSGKPAGEMQEVLSSIKQIIDEDKAQHAAASAEDEDVLELTELEEDEGEEIGPVVSIFEKRSSAAVGATPNKAADPDESRSSPGVVAQLKGLREAAKIAKDISAEENGNAKRVDSYALKAIEPMLETWVEQNAPRLAEARIDAAVQEALQDWMDRHLEEIVERVVREEVARMVAQASED